MVTLKLIGSAVLGYLSLLSPVSAQYEWAQGNRQEACRAPGSTDYDSYVHSAGIGSGRYGYAFCAAKFHDGIFISKLEFQADKKVIRGMIVTFSDGSLYEIGEMDYKPD